MSRITDSARGQSCALRLPGVCNGDPETTVWAHWNGMKGGKAKGKKLARFDHLGSYACYACHMVLDGQAKRPEGLSLEFVKTAEARAMKAAEARLRALGLWPSDEALAMKPVTVQRIVKKVTTAAARVIVKKVVDAQDRTAKEKSREPVSAGRGFPSRKMAHNVKSTAIVAGSKGKENAPSRWPKRKLVSGNKLQSRPFGSR